MTLFEVGTIHITAHASMLVPLICISTAPSAHTMLYETKMTIISYYMLIRTFFNSLCLKLIVNPCKWIINFISSLITQSRTCLHNTYTKVVVDPCTYLVDSVQCLIAGFTSCYNTHITNWAQTHTYIYYLFMTIYILGYIPCCLLASGCRVIKWLGLQLIDRTASWVLKQIKAAVKSPKFIPVLTLTLATFTALGLTYWLFPSQCQTVWATGIEVLGKVCKYCGFAFRCIYQSCVFVCQAISFAYYIGRDSVYWVGNVYQAIISALLVKWDEFCYSYWQVCFVLHIVYTVVIWVPLQCIFGTIYCIKQAVALALIIGSWHPIIAALSGSLLTISASVLWCRFYLNRTTWRQASVSS